MQDNSSDYIFKAYITNTAAYDSGERDNAGTWLYFPANAEEITAALQRLDCRSLPRRICISLMIMSRMYQGLGWLSPCTPM